jgi:hypothetical protein
MCGIGHAMWIIDPDILTVLAFRTRELRDQLGVAMRRVYTDLAADGNIAPPEMTAIFASIRE